jgi:TRAP-type C4-dicarboxylate transport system substrate-binding protein
MGRRFFLVAFSAVLGMVMSGFVLIDSVDAGSKKHVLRWADEIYNNRRADYYGKERFMDLVEERTNGRITFKRMVAGSHGKLKENTEAVQRGTLDICNTFATIMGLYSKSAGALVLPFLLDYPEGILWNMVSLETRELLDAIGEEAGVKVLTTASYEERHFINNVRPIRKLEDAKGLKIRCMESPDEIFWIGLTGAKPGPSNFAELYGMLKSGVFDGYDGNFTVHDSMKYYEVTKYFSIMGYHYIVPMYIVSLRTWKALEPDDQQLLMDCAKQAVIENYAISRRMVERAKLVALKYGNEINEIEDIEEWRKVVMPAYERKMAESPAAKKFVEAVWAYQKKYPRVPLDMSKPIPEFQR